MVRMVRGTVKTGGRRLHFSVSDNPGSTWAVNIHGFLGGGPMYGPESTALAAQLGWRVVNPSLPGFGGSTPLARRELSIAGLADQVGRIVEHLGAGPVILLGHSMGGAVAVRFAHDRPESTLGLIYRAGVATPAWKERRVPLPAVLGPLTPAVVPMVDFATAAILDLPDLLIGRPHRTALALLPDLQRNLWTLRHAAGVASLLLELDLGAEVAALARAGLPLLAEWGCFDRLVGPATAAEFAGIAATSIQWVPGGHFWMLARPNGQADVLRHLPTGRRFLSEVDDRRSVLLAAPVRTA